MSTERNTFYGLLTFGTIKRCPNGRRRTGRIDESDLTEYFRLGMTDEKSTIEIR